MDITKLVEELSQELGLSEVIKKKVAHLGVPPAVVDEIVNDARDIMVDGTMTRDEVLAKLEEFAQKRGVPEAVSGHVAQAIAEHAAASK